MKADMLNAITVAFLGDAVFEVYVRDYLINDCGIVKPQDLQKNAEKFVSAYAQADFMKYAISNELLNETEIRWYKRGRNTKGHSSTNKKTIVHKHSTGFETIIGTLYMEKEMDRLEEIISLYKKYVNLKDEK